MKPRLGDSQEDGRALLGGLGVSIVASGHGRFRDGGASVLRRQAERRMGAPVFNTPSIPPSPWTQPR